MVKHLPAVRETQVRSLGWEDPLEKEMATHTSTLTWKIPWTEELVGYSPWGRKELDMTEQLHFHFLKSQVALVIKNPLPVQERKELRVPSLGQEDPLEEGMVTHSSILAWRIPWTEEPGGYNPRGDKESGTTERLSTHMKNSSSSRGDRPLMP